MGVIWQSRPRCTMCDRPATKWIASDADGTPRPRCEAHAQPDPFVPGVHELEEPVDEMVRRIVREELGNIVMTARERALLDRTST